VVKELTRRFDELMDIENIQEVRDVLLPRVRDFASKADKLVSSNDEMRHCVRKFDEDISIKANYSQLKALKTEFENDFITVAKLNDVQSQIEEQKKAMAKFYEDKFAKCQEDLQTLVTHFCDKEIETKLE